MLRRLFYVIALATVTLAGTLTSSTADAQERIGVLMLHGKSPGSNQDRNFAVLKPVFERQDWLVQFPDMPWSRDRYIDGNWDKAMAEVATHVKALRDKGASKIVIVGHSMGVPAAMSYAVRGGDVQALVLLAPGHIPKGYYLYPPLKAVHDSVDEARALVAAGKGGSRERFIDINQGKSQAVVTTAADYLSYFDPASDAEMSLSAPRLPPALPVLTAIGEKDPLFKIIRGYYVDKLPANPKSKYLEVSGGHLETPREASDDIVAWIKVAVVD